MAVAQMASHEILCSELGKRGAIATVVDMFHTYEHDVPLQQQVGCISCVPYARITGFFDHSVVSVDVVARRKNIWLRGTPPRCPHRDTHADANTINPNYHRKHQRPTTNDPQPTTNNQQPTTNNQQPTTNCRSFGRWMRFRPTIPTSIVLVRTG